MGFSKEPDIPTLKRKENLYFSTLFKGVSENKWVGIMF